MKIKYQSGGVVSYTPFIPQSGGATTSSSSGSTEKADKITGTLQKEIIDVLKENGLQSDVDNFLSQANSFLVSSQNLSAMSLFGGEDDKYTMSHLIGILSMANKVKQNKAQYDLATDKLKAENAWNEVAVASNGYLYVIDANHKMSTISAEEFHKNRDKYQALTNSQVLGLREQDPNLAYRSDILKDAAGAIGMKTISDQLIEVVNKFGTTTRNEYIKNTGEQISQSAWDGMQILIGNGPQGYYKATTKSERENVQSALSYLWRTLGADGQKRLRAETVINGGDPNKNQYDLLMEVLQHHTDYERTVDFDSSASNYDPDGDGKGSSDKTTYVEQTRAERYATGNGFGNSQWFPILSSDKSTPMYISAQNLGPVLNKDEKTLFGDANLEDVLNNAYGLGGIVDRSAITFGELPISWDDASKLMFESGTNMYRALVPAKRDSVGRLRPDFELQEKINHLNSTMENMSPDSIKQAIADIKNVRYNEQTGMIEATNVAPFIILQASASTDTLSKDLKNTKYLHDLTNQEDKRKKTKYNTIISSTSGYGDSTKRQSTDNPRTSWWMGYQFFEGNVFIPINDSIIAASVYNNQYVPKDTYMNMSAKEQARQEQQQKQGLVDEMIRTGNVRLNF